MNPLVKYAPKVFLASATISLLATGVGYLFVPLLIATFCAKAIKTHQESLAGEAAGQVSNVTNKTEYELINPATGFPMIGGFAGVDCLGESYFSCDTFGTADAFGLSDHSDVYK